MFVWSHVGLAGVWGGLLALERRAFLQAMFSRPLVASTGAGLLLEDVSSGLFVGLLLELFYLGGASLGASLPDHDTLAATCAAAAAAAMANASGGGGTPSRWALAVLLFVGMGRVGRWLERALAGHSAKLARLAEASAESGLLARAVRLNLWGMWPQFVAFGALTSASAALGYLLAPLEVYLPLPVVRGLAFAYPAMTSVAAAVAVRAANSPHAVRFALGGALVGVGGGVLQLYGGPLW